MIGPAELDDILLDLQAAATEAGGTLSPEVFHPSFAAPIERSTPQITEDQPDEPAA
jgi:hypothetical protein